MNQQHLTAREIQDYIELSERSERQPEEIESHISGCDHCRQLLLASERKHLNILEQNFWNDPYPDCPADDLLVRFAAHLCSPEMTLQITKHAAVCDSCGPRLRLYLEDAPIGSGESRGSQPSILPESTPSWRSRLKSLIYQAPFKLATVAALGVMVIAATPSMVSRYKLNRAQDFVSAAFGQERPTEMRFAWSPHSEYHVEMGPCSSPSLSHNSDLAAAITEAKPKQHSSDPRWLRINGRIRLLEGGTKDAEEFLQKAEEGGLDEPSTDIDLAVAHFQSTQSCGSGSDDSSKVAVNELNKAVDLLNKVLQSPKASRNERAVASFDLAIAYEKLAYWNQALAVWNQYLALEHEGPWVNEAKDHLEKVKQNIRPPKEAGWKAPGFFLDHALDPETQNSIEEYQDVALRSWLPDALKGEKPDAFKAVQKLAGILQGEHGDPWMDDFLSKLGRTDSPAVAQLSNAINYNRRGFSDKAKGAASDAAKLFVELGNPAGALRARFETVYAQQRQLEQHDCLQEAQALQDDLKQTSYKWLQAQIALEQTSCLLFSKSFVTAQKHLEAARKIASVSRFRVLSLRVLAFETGLKMDSSGCVEGWQPAREGLKQYWAGPPVPLRLYEFFARIRSCLESKHFWHAARALQEQNLAILEHDIDPEDRSASVQVAAHQELKVIFDELDEPSLSNRETSQITRLLDKAPEDVKKYELFTLLRSAEGQLGRGKASDALHNLKYYQKTFLATDDDLIHLDFYRLLGDCLLETKHLQDAESSYEQGLEMAEKALAGLSELEPRKKWINEENEIYRGLTAVFLEQKEDGKALQMWEWYQARIGDISPTQASWQQIERQILAEPIPHPASETRLVFAAAGRQLYLWIVSKRGLETMRLSVKPDEVKRQVEQFVRKCGNRNSDLADFEQDSQEIFSWLLEGAINKINNEDLVVADLDLSLRGLLLETLKSPDGWYFGQRYPVAYSPGFLLETRLNHAAQPILESGLLLDSSSSAGSKYPVLDQIGNEISGLLPTLKRVDGSATTFAAVRTELANARTFFFVGHGNKGELILNSNIVLRPQDFSTSKMNNLQLVVLAACSTGVTDDESFDSGSLVQVFLSSKATSVIASRWNVDLTSTKQFMRVFISSSKNGKSIANSLREARQTIFKEHKHPFYWAAFSLAGRTA